MIAVKIEVTGESVKKIEIPVLASKSVQTIYLQATFDEEWAGYAKTALFWGNGVSTVYAQTMINNQCVIPHEALVNDGILYFGVYGNQNGQRLVTERVGCKIVLGAYDDSQGSVEPTPTQIETIMDAIAAIESTTALVATYGSTTYAEIAEYLSEQRDVILVASDDNGTAFFRYTRTDADGKLVFSQVTADGVRERAVDDTDEWTSTDKPFLNAHFEGTKLIFE